MNFTLRGARAAARSLRRPTGRQPRRFASHGGDHAHGHGAQGESAMHVAGGAGTESFGKSFYYILAGVPITYASYVLATSEGDNFISRFVDQYIERGNAENDRIAHNSMMMKQALDDRALFKTSKRDAGGPDLRWPEMFNAGSPINVTAGEGTADLEELARYYKQKNEILEENRLARMQDGKVVSPYERPDRTDAAAKVLRSAK